MSDYYRGFEDCLQIVLILIKESKNLEDLKKKIEEMLSDLIEKKYDKIRRMLMI